MGKTIEQATKQWVGEFNAVPQSLIQRAFKDNMHEEFTELTTVRSGCSIWSDDLNETCEVISVDREKETVVVDSHDGEQEVALDSVMVENDDYLPMWGTMWSFGDNSDEEWARENPELMSECGFRIYEDEETGDIYFGIDGAGYDFYEAHWIPLYKARGLQWHSTE